MQWISVQKQRAHFLPQLESAAGGCTRWPVTSPGPNWGAVSVSASVATGHTPDDFKGGNVATAASALRFSVGMFRQCLPIVISNAGRNAGGMTMNIRIP